MPVFSYSICFHIYSIFLQRPYNSKFTEQALYSCVIMIQENIFSEPYSCIVIFCLDGNIKYEYIFHKTFRKYIFIIYIKNIFILFPSLVLFKFWGLLFILLNFFKHFDKVTSQIFVLLDFLPFQNY